MSILSWDVGVHNLAFCKLSYDKNNYKFPIDQWAVIDLLDEVKHLCIHQLKSGKVCGKQGSYTCVLKETSEENDIEENKNDGDNAPNGDIQNNPVEEKVQYLCATHSKVKDAKDLYDKIALIKKPTKKEQSEKRSLINLGRSMYKKLDAMPELLEVEAVVIENQPCMKNPTMKSVQMMLFSYFLMKNVENIQLISARNKLKVYKGEEMTSTKKTGYAKTKDLGIKYCEEMIKDDAENLKYLKTHKKKDDLCDAYLQGAFYLANMKK